MINKHAEECIRLSNYSLCLLRDTKDMYSRLSVFIELLKASLRTIQEVNTAAEIKESMATVIREGQTITNYCDAARSWWLSSAGEELRYKSGGIHELTYNELSDICNHINSNKPLTLFSIQCGNGENERNIKTILETKRINVTTYGLDEEDNGAKEAKLCMNKVILGTIKGSTITNNVFDILYVNPRITLNTVRNNNGKLMITNEDNMLTNSIRYLKPGGLLIFNIPFYGLNPGFKLFLSKNLKNITVFKNASGLREDLKFVTVIGIKSANFAYSDTFNWLNNLTYRTLPDHPAENYNINLPDVELSMFRGSVLDEDELTDIVLTDGLYDEFYKSIEDQREEEDKSPLLPFNIGQVGLILSSGSLDGIVNEGGGVQHIIKGMTIKETDNNTEHTVENGRTIVQSTETIRNKVQITALGGDGTIYNLT